MKIKLIEKFFSLQSEARYTGVPSVFLRSFGCNMTCPSFGMPLGEKTTQPDEVAKLVEASPEKYKHLRDIPLVTKGCDSFVSWHPAFKGFADTMTTEQVVEYCRSVLPEGKFSSDKHLVMTGGEPLLAGWQKTYPEIFDALERELGLTNITFETNGTQKLSNELKSWLHKTEIGIHFSCSPKLSASGEEWSKAIKPEIVAEYADCGILDFKFVVDSESGLIEVGKAMKEYGEADVKHSAVYVMPEGGTNETYEVNTRPVAELAMKYGYRYSPRLQNSLFKNEWGT